MSAENREKVGGKYLEYKGKPLVREGDTICYGDMSEKFILILEIMSYKQYEGNEIPDNILIQIIDSKDPNNIIKQATQKGLHDAFTYGTLWLEQALKK
jgi:hypothetical protein